MNNLPLCPPPMNPLSNLAGRQQQNHQQHHQQQQQQQNLLLATAKSHHHNINGIKVGSVLVNHKPFRPGFIRKPNSSGSETDVSTSNENLTPEEHYVLTKGIRQDPQGEETYFDSNSNSDASTTNLNKATNATGSQTNSPLLVNENGSLKYNYNYVSPYGLYGKYPSHHLITSASPSSTARKPPTSFGTKTEPNYYYANSPFPGEPKLQNSNKLMMANGQTKLPVAIDNDSHYSNLNLIKYATANQQSSGQLFLDESVINYSPVLKNNDAVDARTTTSVTHGFVRKNLDTLQLPQPSQTPPPPAYGSQLNRAGSKLLERLTISRSHPDLSKFPDDDSGSSLSQVNTTVTTPCTPPVSCVNNRNNPAFLSTVNENSYNQNVFYRNNYTVEMLVTENTTLRAKLDEYVSKVKKLQNFEIEIQKVHQSHEELMRSSEKKEKLEKALRYKLEMQVRQLNDNNQQLKASQHNSSAFDTDHAKIEDLKKEINRRDVLISQLLTQNKEYKGDKERQEIELQAQRLTLQEQRNHIEILDTALMNAQNNIIALESEIGKKQEFEEKTHFLKNALQNLQLANDRRIQIEKRARQQLEKEIGELKKKLESNGSSSDSSMNGSSSELRANEFEMLKKNLREYDEKIISLETEVSKWEQKYLEESTLRSIEVSAASAPKDAKIAALEWNSQENEKIIAEARNDRLKHMDEIHHANRKFTELESKMKDIESKLAEKDAMIKVLQKHSEDRQAVLQHTLVRRFPNRHSRSASTMGLVANSSTLPKTKGDGISKDLSNLMIGNSSRDPRTIQTTSNLASLSVQESSQESIPRSNSDEQWRKVDSKISTKDSSSSIIQALKNEKERFPNHYNDWRL